MLSKKAKYALKALEFLAENREQGPMRIAEIADSQGFPQKFLEAILLELRKDVIRLMDGPIALVPCVSYKYYSRCEECTDEVTCGLRQVFGEVREATNHILDNVSLADVLQRSSLLTRKASKKKR